MYTIDVEDLIWIYVFIALFLIVLLYYIKNFTKLKIDILKRAKPGMPLQYIGHLEMDDDGSAGEVRLPGCGALPSVGRVIVDKQAGKENGFVEIVATDIQDETTPPRYKQAGYLCFNGDNLIDKYGHIYRQERGKKQRVLVGYCARPSDPETPTIYGERTWRTLWLKCTLNVYAGKPSLKANGLSATEAVHSNYTYNSGSTLEINAARGKKSVKSGAGEQIRESDEAAKIDATTSLDNNAQGGENVTHSADATPQDVTATSSITSQSIGDISAANEGEKELAGDNPVVPANEEKAEEKDQRVSESKEPNTEKSDVENKKEGKDKKKKRSKKQKSKSCKEPIASVSFVGFHSSSKDYLPAEARACAFAALSGDLKHGRYAEFFKEQPYGWRDTALLTSLIYSAIFLVVYSIFKWVLERPIIDEEGLFIIPILTLSYFLLWVLVRLVKIDYIERSNSFQKSLDLLNKNLGLKFFNFSILAISPFAIYVAILEENFDILALIVAIMVGVGVNATLKGAGTAWLISTSFNDKEDEDDYMEDEVRNPDGDISRTYEWDLDSTYSSQHLHGNITLYFTANEIADMRQSNPFFAQRKDKSDKEYILDMFNFLREHRQFMARIRYVSRYINDLINKNGLTPMDKVQFTLDFVQEPNIRFVDNKSCKNINSYENYIRYPDETLYDKEGDCNSKSLLAAMLFHTMGCNVLFMSSRKYKHSAIGIEVESKAVDEYWYGSHIDDIFVQDNGKYYIFCETTGDRFRVGKPIDGMSVKDFEDKVLLEVESGIPLETKSYARSVIYNWDLDSAYGNKLHGNLALKFCEDDINTLRSSNPFMTYGLDANTYELNIKTMFNYLKEHDEAEQNVDEVANYIKREIKNADLPELDLIQFTLNFVQLPNISYCIDEECASIDFRKEYMRYPDETLYDKEGDCDCKSFLLANILNHLGYNVIFMLSKKLKHAAIAVECKDEWFDIIGRNNIDSISFEYNGRRYVYCESTGSGNRVGNIKEGDSVNDFDMMIELLA